MQEKTNFNGYMKCIKVFKYSKKLYRKIYVYVYINRIKEKDYFIYL